MATAEVQPDFQPNDTAEYWSRRWENGKTGWKVAEVEKPFENNIRLVLEAALGSKLEGSDALRASLAGKTVFVPLCGDTYATKYFADQGCAVVGVDIAEASLVAAMQQHFTAEEGYAPAVKTTNNSVVEYAISAADKASGKGSVRYFAGDIFAVMNDVFGGHVFDVVYDRASLMAMHPSLRPQYLAMMRALFRPKKEEDASSSAWQPVMFVDFAIWPKALYGSGPPFHIEAPLEEIYRPAEGYRHAMIEDCDTALLALLEGGGELPAGMKPFSLRNFAVWTVSS